MVIGGKKVERGQNFKELNEHYFQAIKSLAQQSLSELKFVKLISHNISKTSDSMYFNFEMKHHEHRFTLSLRTHQPRVYDANYFYIYLYEYENGSELKTDIQEQLITYYNKQASDYAHPAYSHHTNKKQKMQKRALERCQHCINESFHQLINKINKDNQLAKQMKVNRCVRGHFKRCQASSKL